ncbi:hypothetical protein [Caballeronia choica]|jgi:hypothetical protein|nr:hypothetical protein [Caballeronia choica]
MESFASSKQLFPEAVSRDFAREFFTELSTGCGDIAHGERRLAHAACPR